VKKEWKYGDDTGFEQLSPCKENALLAKLLAIRGIKTDLAAEAFLNPANMPYIKFSAFKDADIVLKRIAKAVKSGEKIVVYGDFDTDGITSTAILYKTLTEIGANVGYYLPDRDSENHGLNTKALIRLISKEKAKLIITVDCGISNAAEVSFAKSFKTDIIITDHHEAPENLPEALAIIDAKASTHLSEDLSAGQIESLCELSGAGIAFKLSSELLKKYKKSKFVKNILPIAAIGTIGDIVPLRNENRRIVSEGLDIIRNGGNTGIAKLLQSAGISDFSKINSYTIAFTVVPRLNAAGRLDSAEKSFKIFVSDDDDELDKISEELNDLNKERQLMCEEANQRAYSIIQNNPPEYEHAIVLQDDETHIGIIGLAASRLVENFNKPAFVMRKDGNKYRCSCRGPVGINIYDILKDNAELFDGYGGHKFAGGFSFDGEKVSFSAVKKAIVSSVKEQTNGETLKPVINIDADLSSDDLTLDILDTIRMLEPFGAENPPPVFAIRDTTLQSERLIGSLQNHLQLRFAAPDGKIFDCLKWNSGFTGQKSGEKLNIAFSLEENVYNGKSSLQLMIKDLDFPNIPDDEPAFGKNAKIIDNRRETDGFEEIENYIEKTDKKIVVFARNKKTREKLSRYSQIADLIADEKFFPEDAETVIFYDCPPNIDFLKNLIENPERILMFMNFNIPEFNISGFLKTLTGMIKYTCSKKGGKATLDELSDNLGFSADCILSALKIIKEQNIFDVKLYKNGIVNFEYKNAVPVEKLMNDENYGVFEQKFTLEKEFFEKMKNLPMKSFKEFILNK